MVIESSRLEMTFYVLIEDVFCPVITSNDSELIAVICSDAHSSALGGHLGECKML